MKLLDTNHATDYLWFQLAQTQGVGTQTLWEIQEYCKNNNLSLSDLIRFSTIDDRTLSSRLRTILNRPSPDLDTLHTTYQTLQHHRVILLTPDHPYFPPTLTPSNTRIPPLLYSRGHTPLALAPSLAIVGSRQVDPDTLALTQTLAQNLARSGYNIVSGYAKGIDTAAHLGALQAEGTTTLVLSLGILNFEARKEFKPWFTATNTLVLSQFPPQAGWFARQAMARNELVCRLAQAVIVITSGPERDDRGRMSGTFAAAKSAFQLGLPVFVLSPHALPQFPSGNADLLQLGGIELFPDRAPQQIQTHLNPTPVPDSAPVIQQLELIPH